MSGWLVRNRLVHQDAVLDAEPRSLRQLDVGLEPEAGDNGVHHQLAPACGEHGPPAATVLDGNDALAADTSTPLLRYSSVMAAARSAGKMREPQARLRKEHQWLTAVRDQGRSDLRANEAAADDGDPGPSRGDLSKPLVVGERSIIDDVGSRKGQDPRGAAGRQEQLVEGVGRTGGVEGLLPADVDATDLTRKVVAHSAVLERQPDLLHRLAFPECQARPLPAVQVPARQAVPRPIPARRSG